MGKLQSFGPPEIVDNPEGWGPPMDVLPEKFRDMPYAPFSKSDRLGRAADAFSHGRHGSRAEDGEFGMDDENAGFQVVDHRQPRHNFGHGFKPRDRNYGHNSRQWNDRGDQPFRRDFRRDNRRFGGMRGYDDRRHQVRESSVEIGPDWDLLEEVQFSALSRAKLGDVSGETLKECGSLEYYDKANERISCRMEKPLKRFEHRAFHYVTTTDDPVIKELASEGTGNVFATGTILALLMASTRSAYPWDIVVQRVGDMLFFDKRDGSRIDLQSVNETAHDQPKDEKNASADESINTMQSLALEATLINQNFSQAMLEQGERYRFPEPNPFVEEGEEEASVAYRYRRWNLGDNIKLVARCELDGAIKASDGEEPAFLMIKALNEVMDPNARQTTDWRGKLDTQRGAILANEVKNNSAKVARWVVQALLAGADQMQIGFVSRVNARDNTIHVVLGTQLYKPREFASQIALNQTSIWGVLKYLVDMCYKHLPSNGKGVIVKDPNSPILRLYSVPENAFEEDNGDEDFAGDGEGDGN
eukprot:CAMPEP_0198730986 /NCGR_PEP_ID=MMETSP1475-20131203/27434_1 /TAXON_ID= ORGANISM="Unidentified sp., Strain CCMP1999" /NCGR_SAMPLE_ID=MMETSP1475 /ASSEMBLY_ACC=CAM_ASM_001111 /LENGTH=530 /DNA_ID=CAMNT_0044493879 /DNA_START=52 /DNA_END=1644 /DNA_ORIENTATION=+